MTAPAIERYTIEKLRSECERAFEAVQRIKHADRMGPILGAQVLMEALTRVVVSQAAIIDRLAAQERGWYPNVATAVRAYQGPGEDTPVVTALRTIELEDDGA